jgi:hypothetical protein
MPCSSGGTSTPTPASTPTPTPTPTSNPTATLVNISPIATPTYYCPLVGMECPPTPVNTPITQYYPFGQGHDAQTIVPGAVQIVGTACSVEVVNCGQLVDIAAQGVIGITGLGPVDPVPGSTVSDTSDIVNFFRDGLPSPDEMTPNEKTFIGVSVIIVMLILPPYPVP